MTEVEQRIESKLRNVTEEQMERIVERECSFDNYPITSKELMSVLRNRYRRLKRFYNVADEMEVLNPA
jgi:hypothetical protein